MVMKRHLSLGQSHFSFKHQKEKYSLVLLAKQVHSAPCSGHVYLCSCMRRGNVFSHVPEFSGKERSLDKDTVTAQTAVLEIFFCSPF